MATTPSGTRNEQRKELEARREKVKAITLDRFPRTFVRSRGLRCRTVDHGQALTRAQLTFCWTPRQPCFALRRFFFLVATPKRSHPFPSRTRKLSSSGPMVLQAQVCGRVGRCRGFEGSVARLGPLLFSARR